MAVDVLPEHDPGDRHGETFGIEEERAGSGGRGCEPAHEQRGTKNPAEQDDQCEPGQIVPAQRGLRSLALAKHQLAGRGV